MNLLRNLAADESGVAAIEYGLMSALISVVIIAAITIVGTRLNATFTAIGTGLQNAITP